MFVVRTLSVGLLAAAAFAPFVALADQGVSWEIEHAYSYATAPTQQNGAAFFHLENESDQALQITAAHADVAERTELHTHVMDGDVMMMRQVDSFTVPAGETLVLEPMGHHVMFMGLKAPLAEGESFPLTLSGAYADGTPFEAMVNVEIQPVGSKMDGGMKNHEEESHEEHSEDHGTAHNGDAHE